ncbi:MAG: FGGY-family carbohydrate kinase, partial [Anaerolineales bacterium]
AIEQVVAINGGARSTLWRQILADVLGVPIRWRPSSEGSAVGAAALAAVGAGVFKEASEIRGWLEPTIDTLPDIGAHQVYVRQHEVFLKVYRDLKESFKVLQES